MDMRDNDGYYDHVIHATFDNQRPICGRALPAFGEEIMVSTSRMETLIEQNDSDTSEEGDYDEAAHVFCWECESIL